MKNIDINHLRALYKSGVNIMEYLRNELGVDHNTTEIIQLAYEVQAGEYIQLMNDEQYRVKKLAYCHEIADYLKQYEPTTILETGVGEATTLAHVYESMQNDNTLAFGFDISLSRINHANRYVKKHVFAHHNVSLAVADLFHIPLPDNSIDVVYTSHTIEPNNGKEKQALSELYRVARKAVILFEPSYSDSDKLQQARMLKLGYATKIRESAIDLDYNVFSHKRCNLSMNDNNPTYATVIEKHSDEYNMPMWCCPVSKQSLNRYIDCLFCQQSARSYPIINGVPCLRPENAIIDIS